MAADSAGSQHRLYQAVAARAQHRCEYCLAPEVIFSSPFEVEHILPRARGGRTTLANLALACRSCNSHKGAAVEAPDPVTQQLVRLYDPRDDSWAGHFRLDVPAATIGGLDACGRATVRRLAMNSPRAVRARHLWLALMLLDV